MGTMAGPSYGHKGVRVSPTPGDVARPGDRLLHDSASGPATVESAMANGCLSNLPRSPRSHDRGGAAPFPQVGEAERRLCRQSLTSGIPATLQRY